MTAVAPRGGGVLPPPLRQPSDYVAVLLVTASAYDTVGACLNGAVAIQKLDDGPRGDLPRFRVGPRSELTSECPLTTREYQVLRLAALGKPSKEIGAELYLSEETVRTHMKKILKRLDARDRTHAVHIAHIHGWLSGLDGE